MKIYNLLFLIFFSAIQCWSQRIDTSGVSINKIPDEGILLNSGWKFQAGDNPKWARTGIDDSHWQTIDPSKDICYLPDLRKAEIGWFRLKLHVDSSLFNEAVALIISQAGASEIYLNGRLLYRFGEVNEDNVKEKTHYLLNRPFSLEFDAKSNQVLAVRYSFNKTNIFINYLHSNPCLQLVLKNLNPGFTDAEAQNHFIASQDLVQTASFMLLGLMCLFFYASFRSQIAYVYIGLYALGQFAQTLLRLIADSLNSTSLMAALYIISHVVSVASVLLAIKGLYILYNQGKSWLFNVIIVYAILTIPAFLFFYSISGLFALCFYLILNLESIRVLIKAVRNHKPGAWVMLTTFSIFYILFLTDIILFAVGSYSFGYVTGTVSLLIVPVGLSLFLATEFGRTGRSLQTKLMEVERLSQKTIEQEKERQHILATQNETLEKQVEQRTSQLKQSLEELKSTQAQLIQSEKMASLGELTAGIAHEIQNPLNFVNNFSEVNKELIEELKSQKSKVKSERDAQLEDELLNDIAENEQKINHHGKRADAIIKGMLQHSRASSGKKEPTDINALADEYLRLAYHGLRAKNKDFNATFKIDFDESIGKIEVVPQDIGRVLLNLYNNAFYAASLPSEGGFNNPTVWVSTKKEDGKIVIRVRDNGPGIPQKVVDKIFQPFFTTKPTGQGTGLGLSLSYDIIKAHGGEIKVDSKEGAGCEFKIILHI